jgi:hypothetical protein
LLRCQLQVKGLEPTEAVWQCFDTVSGRSSAIASPPGEGTQLVARLKQFGEIPCTFGAGLGARSDRRGYVDLVSRRLDWLDPRSINRGGTAIAREP